MILMPINFVIRFAAILFSVLILVALAIQFFFDPHYTVVFWIFAMPFILGTPILASVVLAKNEELDIHSVN
jgi:hypothetical protein